MRNKNKKVTMRMQAVCKLIGLCLKINSLEARTQEQTGNLPTVFIYYSGHVSKLNIQIHSNGWDAYKTQDIEYDVYLNRPDFWKEYNAAKAKLTEMVEGR